jgi:hypothetical protein
MVVTAYMRLAEGFEMDPRRAHRIMRRHAATIGCWFESGGWRGDWRSNLEAMRRRHAAGVS